MRDREAGVAREPVLVEPGDDPRLDAHVPRERPVTTTPKFATRRREADAVDGLRARQDGRDAQAARVLGIAVSRDQRGPAAASFPVCMPGLTQREHAVAAERGRRDATPERNPAHVRASAQLDVPADVALRGGGGDDDRPTRASRDRRPRAAARAEPLAPISSPRALDRPATVRRSPPASASRIDAALDVARLEQAEGDRRSARRRGAGGPPRAATRAPPPWSCGPRASAALVQARPCPSGRART